MPSMLPSFASVDDLAGLFDVNDRQKAIRALWVVSTAIRGETNQSWVDDTGALIEMSAGVADALRSVCMTATERYLRNPEGATSRTDTLGPFGETVSVDGGNVYFNAAEKKTLARAVDEGYPSTLFPGLGTISTTHGPTETGSVRHPYWPQEIYW